MKIVDAYWEERNLGKPCTECIVDVNDKDGEIIEYLCSLNKGYNVIKISSVIPHIATLVQNYGFTYMESSVFLKKKLEEKPQIPSIYTRYKPYIDFHLANESETDQLLDNIKNGDVFSTDRIALDPVFSKQISGLRYSNWTKDLIENGCQINIGTYKNQNVAFGVLTNSGFTYDAVFGGLLPDYLNSGLGFVSLYINTLSAYNQGGKYVETRVSTNNLAILKLHQLFEYTITDFQNVFIKHV